jgi:hypothetical protein
MKLFVRRARNFWISQTAKKQKVLKNSLHTNKTKKLFEQLEEMLGFITNRILNALNVTYAPYASCKALMSVTPDDDIKW